MVEITASLLRGVRLQSSLFFFLLFSNFDWEFHLGVISEMQFGGFGCVTEVSEDQANLVWGQERQGESHSL